MQDVLTAGNSEFWGRKDVAMGGGWVGGVTIVDLDATILTTLLVL